MVMERFPRKNNAIRAWRAPNTDVDDAVAEFLALTRAGEERQDAVKKATERLSTKQLQDFASTLSSIEKAAGPQFARASKVDRLSSQRRKEENQNIRSALERFHGQAIRHGSDMRIAFESIASEFGMDDRERADFAQAIMGAIARKDVISENEDVPSVTLETEAGIREGSTLIPQADAIERLQESAHMPEGLVEHIGQKLRQRQAKLKIHDDGKAEVLGTPRKGRRGGRNRR